MKIAVYVAGTVGINFVLVVKHVQIVHMIVEVVLRNVQILMVGITYMWKDMLPLKVWIIMMSAGAVVGR